MGNRWSIGVWNDWQWVTRELVDVTLCRLNFDYMKGQYLSVDIVLLGFGLSASRHSDIGPEIWYGKGESDE